MFLNSEEHPQTAVCLFPKSTAVFEALAFHHLLLFSKDSVQSLETPWMNFVLLNVKESRAQTEKLCEESNSDMKAGLHSMTVARINVIACLKALQWNDVYLRQQCA